MPAGGVRCPPLPCLVGLCTHDDDGDDDGDDDDADGYGDVIYCEPNHQLFIYLDAVSMTFGLIGVAVYTVRANAWGRSLIIASKRMSLCCRRMSLFNILVWANKIPSL